jgi:serine protease 12 (motopsin)
MGPAKIRLVGGYSSYEGRVEVLYRGVWGTVCGNLWDDSDSQVVCRQLGFSHALNYRTEAFYGQGSGPIWMNSVSCTGSEQALSSCQFSGWGVTDCTHADDVGVVCSDFTARNGDIRLAGGSNVKEGRVEIFQYGTWGTVCDTGFTDTDAKVVCRQLGYSSSSAKAYIGAYYGQGSGTIWLDGVDCNGDELRLVSCDSKPLGVTACYHEDDVGVDCSKLFYSTVHISYCR